ncbi:MAG: methyltransferase domain-containing protein [Thermoflexaceae bacterium]|nr:methyltransferase domain-containing protein [Thermoflexaceae bacterium]
MTRGAWNPDQYLRFRAERSRPFFDLLALVAPCPGGRAADLGCGTGELTPALHRATGAAETVGIDNSETMLAKSAAHAGDGVRFELANIETFEPRDPLDVVFSNAALHWVDDHRALFSRLAAMLKEGGQLAVQVPANHGHPSHTVADEVACEEPFASALGGYRRGVPVEEPEWYAGLFDSLGFREQSVRLQVYVHHLPARADVIEWTRGTLLTDYEKRLAPGLFEAFLVRYRERLLPLLSEAEPFYYPFKRILMWARK